MSDNLLWMQNPELAAALRKRQEGSALMRQGMDASPIQSPWQGVSRLAQALLGGYEARKGDEEITDQSRMGKELAAGWDADEQRILRGSSVPQPAAPVPGGGVSLPAPRGAVTQEPMIPEVYRPIVEAESARTGIPVRVLASFYSTESGFRPDAVNQKSGAAGIGQVLLSTGQNPGYGLPPLADKDRFIPEKAIPWTADYLKARGAAVGATDWTNPAHVGRAARAYGENTDDYERKILTGAGFRPVGGVNDAPSGVHVAGPGAPTGPDQSQPPPQPQAPGQPAIGANAPQVQQAQQLMELASRIERAQPNNPAARQRAQGLRQQAQFLMSVDTYQPTQGGQVNVRTGKVDYAPQPTNVDTGTEIITLDHNGREIARHPKNVAGAAGEKVRGEAAATLDAEAPKAMVTADQILTTIDGVLKHPGLRMGTGATGTVLSKVPGTDAYDFAQRAAQLQGQAFLQAFNTLKGGGQITEVEGKKATDAIARLNTAQSEEAFREALNDFRTIVSDAKARAAKRISPAAPGWKIEPVR